jgi:hypothetical protein
LQATVSSPAAQLHDAGDDETHRRFAHLLLLALFSSCRATSAVLQPNELALSLVLMVAAGLLLRSFWDLFKVPLGFNPIRVMAIETTLPNPNDPNTDIYRAATQESVFLRKALRRIAAFARPHRRTASASTNRPS